MESKTMTDVKGRDGMVWDVVFERLDRIDKQIGELDRRLSDLELL